MAGSAMADTATAPAMCTVPVMSRRRVTVSPSKAPGIWRSAVYFDFEVRCRSSGSGKVQGPSGVRKSTRLEG
jgi:hypothetical protein